MKRITRAVRGYDCRKVCEHEHKGDHGISGGHYVWALVNAEGDIAISLNIHVTNFPESVEPWAVTRAEQRMRDDLASGSGPLGVLCYHTAFPTSAEQVLTEHAGPCDFLSGKLCFDAGSSGLATREFPYTLDKRRLIALTQGEEFWTAMEARLTRATARIRADRMDTKIVICPTCHAKGYIERSR